MVTTTDRNLRITESRAKILPPFELDPTLCLYSPQDNVDSLDHERVREWLTFVRGAYAPPATDARRVALFLPCTKTKPYVASIEHQRINERLLAEGFRPVARGPVLSASTLDAAGGGEPGVFNISPLRRGDLELHRIVISEPLAFVPYELMLTFRGRQSPSVSYDDPGLFENRGNAVSPWRADSSAVPVSRTRWRWGDRERAAYVAMHNAMSETLAAVLGRLADAYTARIAWVAPGLTHRSFVIGRDERSSHGVPTAKTVDGRRATLVGANDLLPDALRIEALPSTEHTAAARKRLADRLGVEQKAADAVYARGGGGATPLALPELLDVLVARIDELGSE